MDTLPAAPDAPDASEPSSSRLPPAAWIGIALAIVVVAVVAYVAAGRIGTGSTASSSTNRSNPLLGTAPPIGKSLPDIRLAAFDGGSVSMASAGHGKPLVVNLWSAQCAPCVSEMPDLEKVFHAYAGRVAFLGVDSQEAEAAGKPLAHRTGVTYPLVSDPTAKVLSWVHSLGLPTTIVVAADGKVAQVHVGRIDPTQLRGWLDQVLG